MLRSAFCDQLGWQLLAPLSHLRSLAFLLYKETQALCLQVPSLRLSLAQIVSRECALWLLWGSPSLLGPCLRPLRVEVLLKRPAALFTITVGSSLRLGRASWAAACSGLSATLCWRRFSVSASAWAEVMLEVLLALLSVLPARHMLNWLTPPPTQDNIRVQGAHPMMMHLKNRHAEHLGTVGT